MLPEARTQQFVYESLEKMPTEKRRGIHVPKVLRTISTDHGRNGWIVMELVRGQTLKKLSSEVWKNDDSYKERYGRCLNEISRGLQLLASLPVSPDTKPGPYGGGRIRPHFFVWDSVAPIAFDSVDMLKRYLNKLATWFSKTAPTVTLKRDLILVFADMHMGNFIFADDGAGDLCIIDFQHASFLPRTFLTLSFRFPNIMSMDVAYSIAEDFDLPMDNYEIMGRLSQLLQIPITKLGFEQVPSL